MNWQNKKVLVTGADGFIGSHLVELLLAQRATVRALSHYNSFNYWGGLEEIPENPLLEVIAGDVRDPHFCKKITKDIDLIFHLAALIAIPYSYMAPDSYVDTNIRGTLNICQAATENGKIRLVHVSTSEVYGTALYVPIDEKHPLQPQSPYSASKIGADAMAMSFFHAFDLPVTIARPFNTYGPRQSARAIIPNIVSQIACERKKIILGAVTPTRDFNYVSDVCRGFLELALCEKARGEVVNIGSNYEISISEVASLIKELMKKEVAFVTDQKRVRPDKSEVFRLRCDNTKLHALTGFKPQIPIREGLQRTIDWFVDPAKLAKYKTNIYNI